MSEDDPLTPISSCYRYETNFCYTATGREACANLPEKRPEDKDNHTPPDISLNRCELCYAHEGPSLDGAFRAIQDIRDTACVCISLIVSSDAES